MPTRSRRGFVPRRSRGAAPAWGMIQVTEQTLAPSAKALIGSFILSNPPLGETVLRTRVRISVRSDQAAAIEFQIGAFGMMVVTDTALGVGVTAIPGPADEGSDDGWFVHQAIVQGSRSSGISGVDYEIDSKAMRKVEEGYSIAIMAESSSVAGNGGFVILTSVRLLSKLTEG